MMRWYRWVAVGLAVVLWQGVSWAARPIISGFGAEGDPEHMANMAGSGLNSHFWCVRAAPQMQLTLDEAGRVIGTLPDEKLQGYIGRAEMAAKYGIDLYMLSGFFAEYITQLAELGPYHKAFVQGPTRYISPGEKGAPGPLEEKYWLGQLLCEARLAAELSLEYASVKGFLVDVEMYGGDLMWRCNSSFDDQTFAAVMARLQERQLVPGGADPAEAQRDQRYDWLVQHNLLKDYFAAQEDLACDVARRFRAEIDKINPSLQLGLLPYEPNWFYNGWLRGLSREGSCVLVCSEEEYSSGYTPTVPATVAYLEEMGVEFRYMPGLFFLKHSPGQLAAQARRCLAAVNGYWLFTTYSLWQKEPEKLRGPYLIQASRGQYWQALGQANTDGYDAGPDLRYVHPGYVLLTNNKFYVGPKLELPPTVTYSREPDVLFHEDPQGTKLFDGGERRAFGTVAWHVQADEEVSVTVDLTRPLLIERLRLDAGHILSHYPSVVDGSIVIMTSMDGVRYYPIADEPLLEGRGKSTADMDYAGLGIRARYVKVVLKAKHVVTHSVWTISELAIWGTP